LLLRENIYDALRAEVLGCRLLPGQEIREQDLAARFSVSRSPVREALLRLAREGLVTVMPRRGYRVNRISVGDARDLFGFRLVVEPACARLAAGKASDDTLRSLDRFRKFNGSGDFIEYNRAFHRAVSAASGNPRMAAVACDLIENADRLVRVSIRAIQGRDTGKLVQEHAAIIDALQRRDARHAARLLRAHIGDARKRILAALDRSAVVA
jgi:DNA-binding GntR family transcriptional regulator